VVYVLAVNVYLPASSRAHGCRYRQMTAASFDSAIGDCPIEAPFIRSQQRPQGKVARRSPNMSGEPTNIAGAVSN